MAAEIIKLTTGKNSRLYSITTRLSNLCFKYLAFNQNPELDSDEKGVIKKGLLYFEDVREGLTIKNGFKTRPFSFDRKTVHSLNALQEVYLFAKNEAGIEEILDTVTKTLTAIDSKSVTEEDNVTVTIQFLDNLSKAVGQDVYNSEASHTL